jgi:hypothetical protein
MAEKSIRDWVPMVGWPVYDLRRRKFGVCVRQMFGISEAHIEGDSKPRIIKEEDIDFEYPKFYINDGVRWISIHSQKGRIYYVQHVHYHVPKDIWQYTIALEGMEGFDKFVVTQDELEIVEPYSPK